MSKKVSVIHKESVIYPLLGNYLLGKSKKESVIYPLFINPALNNFTHYDINTYNNNLTKALLDSCDVIFIKELYSTNNLDFYESK